ncbi:MAG TPA: metallophosphoesterase, partial [Phycicoccus sp.]|nr:metallophosphoesterase [Phycicoccus sp.]
MSTDRTGDHAFTDVVDGEAEAPETPMQHLPARARLIFLGVLSLISLLLFGVGAWGLVPPEAQWPALIAWSVRGLAALSAVALVILIIRSNSARGTDGQGRVAHVLLGVGWIVFSMTLVTDLVLRLPLLLAGVENPIRS